MNMTPITAPSNDNSQVQHDHTNASEFVALKHTDLGEIQFSIQDALAEVAGIIAPVWPLRDYVAVNPYAGLSSKRFLDARQFLQSFSDCELLMPLEYYAAPFRERRFGHADIRCAIDELRAEGLALSHSAAQIVTRLAGVGEFNPDVQDHFVHRSFSRMQTVAEIAASPTGIDWTEVIRDEISKHCASHYDEGQATWPSRWADRSLYQAWREAASCDRCVEILGLSGFRSFAAQLPPEPEAAIARMLSELNVPQRLWTTFLMCQAFSIPGWSAWTKYQAAWKHMPAAAPDQTGGSDLTGLLAMRIAYDVALASAKSLSIRWSGLTHGPATNGTPRGGSQEESAVRMVLLRASELGFGNGLLNSLNNLDSDSPSIDPSPKLAQMVFCIDVRSERMRRQFESLADDVETFGFAGFFGMPIEFVSMGSETGEAHVPALLKPKFKLREGLPVGEHDRESKIISRRKQIRSWRWMWSGFQTSALGCFSFVETTGLLYGWKLATRALGIHGVPQSPRFDAVPHDLCNQVRPLLDDLAQQGVAQSQQVDLAESMLRGVGITKDFASLVVLCGHASQTNNNPLAAGLDCGACGGHSGEPNARMAAMLLNQPSIRIQLAERGIKIPDTTHFLAGLHITTTDTIEYFDLPCVPASHARAVSRLMELSTRAGEQTRRERMPIVNSKNSVDLFRRAVDWSEVRPEWALAGNAAFIVAPRFLTRGVNLDGRSFLHSYDHRQDPRGEILEAIMTAPLVVAHWINMQYFASTVDGKYFGSGTKTVHNVVGQFGILSGNGGDLMTGLPWQSVHNGETFQHSPMRLQAVIAAPRASIDRVLEKHVSLAELIDGDWLHLIAIEDGRAFRRDLTGEWNVLSNETE